MRQNIPTSQNGLLGAMNLAINGGTIHSGTVTLVRTTVPMMTTARTEATAARDARDLAKKQLHELRQLLELERIKAREYTMLTRDQLKPALGRLHHPGWDVVGFRGKFYIPQDAGDLELMLETITAYLTENPDKQISAQNVTAIKANERYMALKNARAAVKTKEGELTTRHQRCQAKFAAMLAMLRSLVKELSLILSPLDGRWTAFGFNLPGAKQRPETPTNVTAVLVGPTAASVKWERAPRAETYRVWIRYAGVDADFILASSKHDLDVILEGLSPDTEIEIAVSAMNSSGESRMSEIARVRTGNDAMESQ